MKKSLPKPQAGKFNKCFVLLLFILSFAFGSWCTAQSIVGKWNQLKIKTYFTPEGAKTNGNQTETDYISTIGKAEFVFYSNHTYRMESSSGDSKVKTFLGTWSLSGNQLTMQLLAQQEDPKDNPKKGTPPEQAIVSFNGNMMEWTKTYTNNPTISKIVLVFAKNS
jgi:hypothetical protein